VPLVCINCTVMLTSVETLSFASFFLHLSTFLAIVYICLISYKGAFSLGEAIVVSQGISLYAIDAIYHLSSARVR
jgi:hypothetical protein